jgi:hypothetical protein
MNFYLALEDFGAALKAMKAAEIAYVGAIGTDEAEIAQDAWTKACEASRKSGVRLLAAPARSPADLVMKAKALRLHCPDGVMIEERMTLGAGAPPPKDAPLQALALHYIVRDLMAFAE